MIKVRTVTDADAARWEDYLRERGVQHHAYSWAWRSILQQSFGHAPHYLIAEDSSGAQSVTAGVLPLFFIKSILFGRALISVPYLNAGGIIASSEIAYQALLHRTQELLKELNGNYLELRHIERPVFAPSTLHVKSHKVSMILPLVPDSEALFNTFPAKLRSQVRRPMKSGATASVHTEDPSAVKRFYKVFAENMRDLGTPVYPESLIRLTADHFGKHCRIILVKVGDEDAAAGLIIGKGTAVEIPWASALRRFNSLSVNMLLYWEVLKASCELGYQTFDFGRSSPDAGTFKFKAQWGAQPTPLHWLYHVRAGEVPDVNPKNSKFSLLVNCWQRLPLPIANALGPTLTKSLP